MGTGILARDCATATFAVRSSKQQFGRKKMRAAPPKQPSPPSVSVSSPSLPSCPDVLAATCLSTFHQRLHNIATAQCEKHGGSAVATETMQCNEGTHSPSPYSFPPASFKVAAPAAPPALSPPSVAAGVVFLSFGPFLIISSKSPRPALPPPPPFGFGLSFVLFSCFPAWKQAHVHTERRRHCGV